MKVSGGSPQAMPPDIPLPSIFLPAGWTPGDPYTAPASLLGTNNPQFINGPVPMPAGLNLRDISTVGSYNFRLKTTSPCANKGYTGFAPRTDVPVDPIRGGTELTPPGKDLVAYTANA